MKKNAFGGHGRDYKGFLVIVTLSKSQLLPYLTESHNYLCFYKNTNSQVLGPFNFFRCGPIRWGSGIFILVN
jgi:hypothetical protein